ncbi:hypothetical protein D5086_017347 [Populus alba]|uniref:Uncharacterized protein n=1 Tax=Populus alba TaxID=43335 RepID=A0ACC4BX45_POPAL
MLDLFSLPRFWCLDVSTMVSHLYTGFYFMLQGLLVIVSDWCSPFFPEWFLIFMFFCFGHWVVIDLRDQHWWMVDLWVRVHLGLFFHGFCNRSDLIASFVVSGVSSLTFVGAFEFANDAALNAATLCEIWWHFQTLGSVSIWFILLRYDCSCIAIVEESVSLAFNLVSLEVAFTLYYASVVHVDHRAGWCSFGCLIRGLTSFGLLFQCMPLFFQDPALCFAELGELMF